MVLFEHFQTCTGESRVMKILVQTNQVDPLHLQDPHPPPPLPPLPPLPPSLPSPIDPLQPRYTSNTEGNRCFKIQFLRLKRIFYIFSF